MFYAESPNDSPDEQFNEETSSLNCYHETGSVAYAPGNVFELSFRDEFDIIIITEVIEHVAHPDEFLRKIATMVRPGGYVVMTTPNGEYFRNGLPKFSDCLDPSRFESEQFKPNSDGHIFLLHVDELEPLACAAGLQLAEVKLFTNPLTNGHLKTGLLLSIFPRSMVEAIERWTSSMTTGSSRKWQVQMLAVFRKL